MSSEFIVRSRKESDPQGTRFLLARDKILSHESAGVRLLQQTPNSASPTRILVAGDEASIRALLQEFEAEIEIAPNKKIHPL